MSTVGIGHNIGAGSDISSRLEIDHAELINQIEMAILDTRDLPADVGNANDLTVIASAVKELRDLCGRAIAQRVAEKAPYLRAGDEVYAFFTTRLIEPLTVKGRELTKRIDDFKQRQLAEERAARQREQEAARKEQEAARRAAEEAAAAARRARSPDNRARLQDDAEAAKVEQYMADARAEQAKLAALAKPAQLVGERFEGKRGGKVTVRQEAVVIIDDVAKLDLELLRPYFKEEHLLMALRGWAKATEYAQPMAGATIGKRDAVVVK